MYRLSSAIQASDSLQTHGLYDRSSVAGCQKKQIVAGQESIRFIATEFGRPSVCGWEGFVISYSELSEARMADDKRYMDVLERVLNS